MTDQIAGVAVTWVGRGRLEAALATEVGPRIMGFRVRGGRNVLAELPDEHIPVGDGRVYRFRGGHRLWVAPELPAVTYEPDDGPVTVEGGGDRISVRAANGPVAKEIAIELDEGGMSVRHRLVNGGADRLRLAAWAITQLRPGGIAVLPLRSGSDEHGLQADRSLVLWPYATLDDPLISVGEESVRFMPGRTTPTKLGSVAPEGDLEYLIDGWHFTKSATARTRTQVDLGATAQIYATGAFVELETVGPLVDLDPGTSVEHTERWLLRSHA